MGKEEGCKYSGCIFNRHGHCFGSDYEFIRQMDKLGKITAELEDTRDALEKQVAQHKERILVLTGEQ
jgi:hypothetical protein